MILAGMAFLYLPMELTEKGQPSVMATLLLASGHGWGALLLWASLSRHTVTSASSEVGS